MQSLYARCFSIASWASIALFALLPIAVIPVDWISVSQSKGLLIGVVFIILIVAWVLGSVSEGFVRIPKHVLPIAAALLPIAYITSALVSGASWSSYVGGGTTVDTVSAIVIFYGIFFIIASLYSAKSIIPLVSAFLTGCGVVLVFHVARLFVHNDLLNLGGALPGVATSVVGSWHDLAIIAGLFAFLLTTASRGIFEKRFIQYVFPRIAIFAGLFLVVVNLSDVWFGVAGLFGAYALYLLAAYWKYATWRGLMAQTYMYIVPALIAVGLGYGGVFIQAQLPDILQITHVEVRPSWQGTFAIGEQTLSGKELWFGTGPNTFAREWGLYKPQEVNVTDFWSTDFYAGIGTVPTSVVTVGLFGAFAWAVLIVVLCAFVFRGPSAREDPLNAVLFVSILFLTAFQVLYTPGIALSLLTFLFYALLLAHRTREGFVWHVPIDVASLRGGIALALVSVIVLAGLFLNIQSLRSLISDLFLNKSVQAFGSTNDVGAATPYVEWASALFPNNDKAHRAAVELGFAELRNLASRGAETAEQQQVLQQILSQTITRGLSAVSVESGNYQNWLLLARLYSELASSKIGGAETQARQAYAQARVANPTNPLPVMGLAQLEVTLGNTDAARKLLFEVVLLKPNLAAAHLFLSRIEAGDGNFEKALESAKFVTELASEDALSWYNLGAIFYAKKDWKNAIEALERAVALQTRYADALLLLALSQYEVGNEDAAIVTLTALSLLDPTQDISKQILKNIQDGFEPLAKRKVQ